MNATVSPSGMQIFWQSIAMYHMPEGLTQLWALLVCRYLSKVGYIAHARRAHTAVSPFGMQIFEQIWLYTACQKGSHSCKPFWHAYIWAKLVIFHTPEGLTQLWALLACRYSDKVLHVQHARRAHTAVSPFGMQIFLRSIVFLGCQRGSCACEPFWNVTPILGGVSPVSPFGMWPSIWFQLSDSCFIPCL